jgi:hypothetical protein
MAYAHLQRHVGALRLGLEFERARDSAQRLVRTNWRSASFPSWLRRRRGGIEPPGKRGGEKSANKGA